MTKKIVVNDYDDFRKLEGTQIVKSEPVEITAEGIQDFCRGTYNDEWIHWDREKCQASPLGDLIAPGLYLPALFPLGNISMTLIDEGLSHLHHPYDMLSCTWFVGWLHATKGLYIFMKLVGCFLRYIADRFV